MQLVNPVVLDALFWLAVAGSAVAQFFILRTAFRPLSAPQMVPSSRRPMEIVWAILPTLLLAAAFVLAWRSMHPSPDASQPLLHAAGVLSRVTAFSLS